MKKSLILSMTFLTAFAAINAMDPKKQQNQLDQKKEVLKSEQGFTLYSDGSFIIDEPNIKVIKSATAHVFTFIDKKTGKSLLYDMDDKTIEINGMGLSMAQDKNENIISIEDIKKLFFIDLYPTEPIEIIINSEQDGYLILPEKQIVILPVAEAEFSKEFCEEEEGAISISYNLDNYNVESSQEKNK